ncbi:MAG TPA: S1 family peptidase [Oligoflexia bacterium]|nr:S1 family peptidase [Oligoflexia bacterium]HMP26882.1 S1 family peptidase [Oligoflexia bacterium]
MFARKKDLIKFFLVIFLIISLVSCGGDSNDDSSSSACAVIGLPTKIINGTACGENDRSPVVRVFTIVRDKGTGQTGAIYTCTATMLTADGGITAAHCFSYGDLLNQFQILGTAIGTGNPGSIQLYTVSSIKTMSMSFGPNGRVLNDLAVFRLRTPANVPTLPINLSSAKNVGDEVFVYGYGQTKITDDPSPNDLATDLLSGETSLINVTNELFFIGFSNKKDVNVCFGDSGGPLVHLGENGATGAIGVLSQGANSDCGVGDVNSYTNITTGERLSFIQKNLPGARYN